MNEFRGIFQQADETVVELTWKRLWIKYGLIAIAYAGMGYLAYRLDFRLSLPFFPYAWVYAIVATFSDLFIGFDEDASYLQGGTIISIIQISVYYVLVVMAEKKDKDKILVLVLVFHVLACILGGMAVWAISQEKVPFPGLPELW